MSALVPKHELARPVSDDEPGGLLADSCRTLTRRLPDVLGADPLRSLGFALRDDSREYMYPRRHARWRLEIGAPTNAGTSITLAHTTFTAARSTVDHYCLFGSSPGRACMILISSSEPTLYETQIDEGSSERIRHQGAYNPRVSILKISAFPACRGQQFRASHIVAIALDPC